MERQSELIDANGMWEKVKLNQMTPEQAPSQAQTTVGACLEWQTKATHAA